MPQEQDSPGIKTTPYMSPMHLYGSAITTLTNPENELHRMELTFRSAYPDAQGNPILVGEPLMNDYGINSIIGMTQSLVNRISVLSNLEKNEVFILMDFFGDSLSRDLMLNRTMYGVKSSASRDKIFFTTWSTAYVTLKRAFEEGDKRFWKGSVQEIHSKVEGQTKKGGLLSALNPWGKK